MKRTNANYQIVLSSPINTEQEIVIAYNPISELWVCWTCYFGSDYRAGTYSDDGAEALEEYLNRGGY